MATKRNSASPGDGVLLTVMGQPVAAEPGLPAGTARRGAALSGGSICAVAAIAPELAALEREALSFSTSRAAVAADVPVDIAAQDLLELHYADGIVLWTSGAQLHIDLAHARAQGGLRRGVAGTDGQPLRGEDFAVLRGNVRRGGGDGLQGLVRYKTAAAATAAFAAFEQKTADNEGLYKVLSPGGDVAGQVDAAAARPLSGRLERLQAPLAGSPAQPVLLLLHGTFSSFAGSYRALGAALDSESGITPLSRLYSHYKGQVYAYEHASVTRSVLENLARLAAALGSGLTLDVVSYSRGGLLAELLARAELEDPFDLPDARLTALSVLGRSANLRKHSDDDADGKLRSALDETVSAWWSSATESVLPVPRAGAQPDAATIDALAAGLARAFNTGPSADTSDSAFHTAARELYWLALARQELRRARPQLRRQVRVAAPVSGTSLADGRLDHWISGLINQLLRALEKTGSTQWGEPVATVLQPFFAFLRLLVRDAIDVENVRGLASMRAGNAETLLATSARVALGKHADARLLTISSDFKGGDGWAGILRSGMDWLSERFFGGPNDLVVNTRAMTAGLARPTGTVAALHLSRDGLIHINYFYFFEVRSALIRALTGEPDAVTATSAGARRGGGAVEDRQSRVILIPGLGGNELLLDKRKVWLDYQALALADELSALADRRGKVSAGEISAIYQPLLDHFDYAGFKVEPFTYDWSYDLQHAGDALAARLEQLKDRGRIVHFVAHSSGGLVLRAMAGRHPGLWREVMAKGGRAVMLGTPNQGSWAVVDLLQGDNRVVQSLAGINPWLKPEATRQAFARMTGVLQLLPRLDPGKTYPGLDLDRIAVAATRLSELAQSASFQQRVVYIAGQALLTPDGTSSGTPEGDGWVPWSNGAMPEQAVRYAANVGHGNLISDRVVLNEVAGFLRDGTWTKLSTARPPLPASAGMPGDATARKPVFETLPPPDALVGALLGVADAVAAGARADTAGARLVVTTTHGNLVHAIYPIMLGHYIGDGLYSTERTLDERLEGRLSESLRLRLYPGAVGTAQVFLDDSRRPTGAVVVGLGEIGELTPSKLRQAFSRGIRELSQALFQQQTGADYSDGFDMYTVLIGSTGETLSILESVESTLNGALEANAEIDRGNERRNPRQLRTYPRLARLHFVELWEDRAHLMRSELVQLARREEFRHRVDVRPGLNPDRGRQRRLFAQEDMTWWRRLLVQCDARGQLRFKALTDRARMMSVVRPTQSNLVSLLMEQMTESGAHDPQLGQTLHELLIPNEFKERQADDRPVVFVVDERSAAYPWELLIDPKAPSGKARSVAHGIVRQLKTSSFTDQPLADQRSALIIGDTDSGMAALPGAIAEANAVAVAFRNASDWPEPVLLNRPRAAEVLIRLFAQPWRVLHFAAHGVHNYRNPTCGECGADCSDRCSTCPVLSCDPRKHCANPPRSGMVLGPGLYLTPVEIAQMRAIPEFVFLNCCYLARSDGKRAVSGLSRLGANLATQLISMGVRAVVAAGWAVNDEAGNLFARTFYDSLLGGNTFGDATRGARQACQRRYPGDNTWGAYQCYGDPAWRLDSNGRRAPQIGNWEADPQAAYAEFYNLQRRAEVCRIAELERERERYVKLLQAIESKQESWLHLPHVAGARARAALALALDELVDKALADAEYGNNVDKAILLRTRTESFVRGVLARCLGAASSPQAAESQMLAAADSGADAAIRQELEEKIRCDIHRLETADRPQHSDGRAPGYLEQRRLILRLRFAQAWINGADQPAFLQELAAAARDLAGSHGKVEIQDRVSDGLRDLRLNNARLYELGADLLTVLYKVQNDAPVRREAELAGVRTEIQRSLEDVRERAEDRNDYRFIAHYASLRILRAIVQDNLDDTPVDSGGRSESVAILEYISATLDRGVPHVQLQRSIDWVAFMRDLHPDPAMRGILHALYLNAYQRLDRRGDARLLLWRARRLPPAAQAEPDQAVPDQAEPDAAAVAPSAPAARKRSRPSAGAKKKTPRS
jgi:CHAT domain-containing protein